MFSRTWRKLKTRTDSKATLLVAADADAKVKDGSQKTLVPRQSQTGQTSPPVSLGESSTSQTLASPPLSSAESGSSSSWSSTSRSPPANAQTSFDAKQKIDTWATALKRSESISIPSLRDEPISDMLAVTRLAFDNFRRENEGLRKVVDPVVKVLHKFVLAAGEAGSAPSGVDNGSKAVAGALAVLFDAAKSVSSAYDGMQTLFSELDFFLVRREIYEDGPVSSHLQKVIDDILRQTVDVLVLGSRMIEEGRAVQYLRYFPGKDGDYQKALKKLDELTRQETRVLVAETHQNVQKLLTSQKKEAIAPEDRNYTFKPQLPPKPHRVVGREQEISSIVRTLLYSPPQFPPRIAILGFGGMGKTTTALTVLHHPAVKAAYPRRFFVACEGITSIELLYKELADVVRVPPSQRDAVDLMEVIKTRLAESDEGNQGRAALCLDNFETPWEDASGDGRRQAEGVLEQLAEVESLAIVVTLRGAERPAKTSIPWSKPFLPPLRALEPAQARALFIDVGGLATGDELDEHSANLLTAVGGIPLAITLLASLVADDLESTKSIWARWQTLRTKVIENGGQDRLSRLDTSIALSVHSPRIRKGALGVLHMFALLPDGFSAVEETGRMEALQGVIKKGEGREGEGREVDVSDELKWLKRAALVEESKSESGARIVMLEPIRQYVLSNVRPVPDLQPCVVRLYVDLMRTQWNYTSAASRAVIQPEFVNIHAVLAFALSGPGLIDVDGILQAAVSYTNYTSYFNISSQEIIRMALSRPALSPLQSARCLRCLGAVQSRQDELDLAEQSLRDALALDIEAKGIIEQAYDHQLIGQLHRRRGKLDEAEQSFQSASSLHAAEHDVLGQANTSQFIGECRMRKGDVDYAERLFADALKLHVESSQVLGQANDHMNIGQLQMQRGQYADAEESIRKSQRLHVDAHNVMGQANDLRFLGELNMRRDRLDEAESVYRDALKLYLDARSLLGQGACYNRIAEILFLRDKYDDAEEALQQAVPLHIKAQDIWGQAEDQRLLGSLHTGRKRFLEAQDCLSLAMQLSEKFPVALEQGNVRKAFGELRKEEGREEEAAKVFGAALEIYRRCQDMKGQMDVMKGLVDVYKILGREDKVAKLVEESKALSS